MKLDPKRSNYRLLFADLLHNERRVAVAEVAFFTYKFRETWPLKQPFKGVLRRRSVHPSHCKGTG